MKSLRKQAPVTSPVRPSSRNDLASIRSSSSSLNPSDAKMEKVSVSANSMSSVRKSSRVKVTRSSLMFNLVNDLFLYIVM